jgi:hypothetical protein
MRDWSAAIRECTGSLPVPAMFKGKSVWTQYGQAGVSLEREGKVDRIVGG